jgi:hypothetical protein
MKNTLRLAMAVVSLTALLMLTSGLVLAQGKERVRSGIYPTAADYKAGRLAFEGDCGSNTHKLELHDVLNKPYIDVTHDSEKRRLQKSELFGFRACDGRDYRFVAAREYRILEARELYIYVHDTRVPAGKASRTVPVYSFSVGPDGPVLPLTLEDLKRAFPENHRFHDSLDMTFEGGRGLEQYDDFHKMYKVNRLLIASREQER